MAQKYSRDQLRQLYIKLPQEIKDVVSDDEAAKEIEEICGRNGIDDERVGKISDLIRDVLFGLQLPEEFQKELEKEAGLNEETAKKISREINRFVFYPVKPALEQLQKIEVVSQKPNENAKSETILKPAEEYQAITKKDDTYREPIE